ncbi:MAG: protein translocase subunit SecF [Actinomycetota bacterium]|nr:protein translocase subunit SecF [Actinomycetota bacterium]
MSLDESRGTAMEVGESGRSRLFRGQTAIDFYGRRRLGLAASLGLLVLTLGSLGFRGLDLGIDFEGGVSWDVPASSFGVAEAEALLDAEGVSTDGARIQLRSSESGEFVKVQVEAAEGARAEELRAAFAEAAQVAVDDVGVNLVSSSWGSDVTGKAIRALLVFLVLVAVFISIRFEWRMAVGAIVAMLHDVVISVGIYSVFGFVVTPATVIAFLTILGYSLYDTIVVFDRIRENEARLAAHRAPFADVMNISMNQVIMRSVNTSLSSVVPVVSLLLIGAGLLGASTLSEFAIALLIGMVTGAYSSIFIAAPLLAVLKGRSAEWRDRRWARAVGEPLRAMVMGGLPAGRRVRGDEAEPGESRAVADAASVLNHAPRPRRKKRH